MENTVENPSDIRKHRTSITPSGYFGNGKENIVEIENLLTEEENEYLLNFIKNNEVWDQGQDVKNENGTIIYQHNVWANRVATRKSLDESDPAVSVMLESIIERLTVIYLNEDYEGGRLHFPKQEIAFKPKARAAYFFPGDLNYIHGVDIITEGTRYTSPWFWTITKLGEKVNG